MKHGFRLFFLLPFIALAASIGRADLQSDIKSILSDELLRGSQVSVVVEAMPDGRALYHHNEHQLLMPASNMKILTTSAALNLLGPEFRFRTLLVQRGEDLVLIGDGDPSFGDAELLKKSNTPATAIFQKWAEQLRGRTFRHCLVDDSV